MYQRAQQLPKIHDISTDTCDPPAFVAVLPLRQGARNPVDYRPDSAAQQRKGYADIVPMRMSVAPQEAFGRAPASKRSSSSCNKKAALRRC